VKGVSNIIALLIIVGIVIALAVVVSNIVLTQVSGVAQQPKHVQTTGKDVVKLGTNSLNVKLSFYNPTNLEFNICPTSANLYMNGFSSSSPLTLVDTSCVKVLPGESGKLELVVRSQNPITQGVLSVSLSVMQTGNGYTDLVLIPLK